MTAALAISDDLAAQTLGDAGRAIYQVIHGCRDPDRLDEMGRLLWKCYGEGSIAEGEAEYLNSIIERRRPLGRRTAPGHAGPLYKVAGRVLSRFGSRQRQRSPDRKASRDRRRMLGGSSALPDNLRRHYTEGQRSVLFIVAREVKRHDICDLPFDKIAALAGVCRTTVQTTMHEARRLGQEAEPYPPDGQAREWWQRLKNAFGTASSPFVDASLQQLIAAARLPNGGISEIAVNATLAFVEGAKPQSEVESALVMQMGCTHAVAMAVLGRAAGAHGPTRSIAAMASAAARLLRTYAIQVETWRRLRNGGSQFVRVEHVHVNEGGQAVIGSVAVDRTQAECG